MNRTGITKNSAKCAYCGTEVESTFRHDFVEHICDKPEAIDGSGKAPYFAVDGGKAYLRRVYRKRSDFIETSVEGPDDGD